MQYSAHCVLQNLKEVSLLLECILLNSILMQK